MRYNKIGLCGSHRTGKTTLGITVSERLDITFVKTNTSEVFKQCNLNPAASLPFGRRLQIQHLILDDAIKLWSDKYDNFISDRTPLDMLAYTLSDIQGCTEANFEGLQDYIKRCFDALNHFFDFIILIQPGIAIRYEEGKAALNRSYFEHLNAIIAGLCIDERTLIPYKIMPRRLTDLNERIEFVCQLVV